jgi:hypothetical protein
MYSNKFEEGNMFFELWAQFFTYVGLEIFTALAMKIPIGHNAM